MKYSFFVILAALLLNACQLISPDNIQKNELLSTENIAPQIFSISSSNDTSLIGNSGTVISFSKNTFVDQDGSYIEGEIEIELKECLTKLDFVLSNMTTTSNGLFLESGGMIYINATIGENQLAIAEGKSIGVAVPTHSVMEGMQLYEGVQTENGLDWQNPRALEIERPIEDLIGELVDEEEQPIGGDLIKKQCNVGYYVRGYHYEGSYGDHNYLHNDKMVPGGLLSEVSNICWSGNGMILSRDSIIQIDTFEVVLVKMDTIFESETFAFSNAGTTVKGLNQFREDNNNKYIFSIKKLGWANIDRLFNDPRTQEIKLIVVVQEQDEYDKIYTSMIFKNQDMYLPGYQKKDNSFSFTHGDYEKTSLPIGETATILITAYKGDEAFYAIETITIEEAQIVTLKLETTTQEDLKNALKDRI